MNWIGLLKVSIVFIIFSLIILNCQNDYPILKEESKEKFANLRFSNFKRIQYKGIGIKKWELNSKEAYIYQEEKTQTLQKIIVYNFEFKQYLPQEANFKAKKAVLDYIKNIMYLEGNAEYKDKEVVLQSDFLIYNLEKAILDTNIPVIIKRKNSEVKCLKGLYYDKDKDIQICRNPAGKMIQPQNQTKQNEANENFFF
ncbi:MAG: hypothetical protein KatS3mg129_1540 [Leptospiraceae bacterium]|nr:MAG: hypothetical protein KatS3mg129_1540 [Leptospiraceae bacterium]